jgi:two-component system NtrC family response regulator
LVVDDEELCRRALARLLSHNGFLVSTAADADSALEILSTEKVDVVLTDLEMPNCSGLELVRRVRERDQEEIPCIVMTGYGNFERSVEALRAGAFWYLEKPFDKDFATLHRLLAEAMEQRRQGRAQRSANQPRSGSGRRFEIIGKSRALERVLQTARKVAPSSATVLITGESGTGKELIARTIHGFSSRTAQPFITINCGAIPEELLESELFGHVRGAFTNAVNQREGRFTCAHGGTIFLDEIGEMSLNLQVKLLRVLQDGTFEPVGSSITQRVDVRTLAATNQDLPRAIREHRFREDLYYRLNVVPITMPPLRERSDDIPLLIEYFLDRAAQGCGSKVPRISPAAMERLCAYGWPGNVRELENMIERLVILSDDDEIDVANLPVPLYASEPAGFNDSRMRVPPEGLPFSQTVNRFETHIILQALERTKWNKTRAAQLLGLNRTTLLEMIKKKGLEEQRAERDS